MLLCDEQGDGPAASVRPLEREEEKRSKERGHHCANDKFRVSVGVGVADLGFHHQHGGGLCLSLCLYALTLLHPPHFTTACYSVCFDALLCRGRRRGTAGGHAKGERRRPDDEDEDDDGGLGCFWSLTTTTATTPHRQRIGKPLSFRADRDPGGIVCCALPPFGPLARARLSSSLRLRLLPHLTGQCTSPLTHPYAEHTNHTHRHTRMSC